MPIVMVKRDPRIIDDDSFVKINMYLQTVVAQALDAPDEPGDTGRLVPEDIEIWPLELSPFAVNNKPLEIVIFAQDFPTRRLNVEARAEEIGEKLKSHIWAERLSRIDLVDKRFVWIFMGQTGFHMF